MFDRPDHLARFLLTCPELFPRISITVAMILGSPGLVLLLIFIHHTGAVIQVCATHAGYVKRIVFTRLHTTLRRPGLHLQLLVCPGDFVTAETVIAEVRPAQAADRACRRAILESVYIERERDFYQDALFGVRQLADIALRALSPAVNDPTTGILCIKYLQAVCEHFVRCPPQPQVFHVANGASSLEISHPAMREYLEVFLEIAHYAGGNARDHWAASGPAKDQGAHRIPRPQ